MISIRDFLRYRNEKLASLMMGRLLNLLFRLQHEDPRYEPAYSKVEEANRSLLKIQDVPFSGYRDEHYFGAD